MPKIFTTTVFPLVQSESQSKGRKVLPLVIKYEATYIVDPNLAEEVHNGLLDRISGTITDNGGNVIDVKNMGRRRLTHEVKGKIEGIYICMRFDSSPAAGAELSRQLKLADEVLRGLIIKLN